MQAERDHLVRFVFPEMEQLCADRGVEFVAVDLRWGVTREEAESGQLVDVCLNEIENCRPFFVCMLGERYGWLPLPAVVPEDYLDQLDVEAKALFADAYSANPGFGEFLLRPDASLSER